MCDTHDSLRSCSFEVELKNLTRFLPWTLLAVIIFGLRVETIKPTPAAVERAERPPRPAPAQPINTKAFYLRELAPLLAEATASHPVPAVRDGLRDVHRRQREGVLRIRTTDNKINFGGMAAIIDGQKTILINVRPWRQDLSKFNRNSIMDVIAVTILHELYHLDHHPIGYVTQNGARIHQPEAVGTTFMKESEAWWWVVETLVIPIREAGRLQDLLPESRDYKAIQAYKNAHGDPTSPAWTAFVKTVTTDNLQEFTFEPSSP